MKISFLDSDNTQRWDSYVLNHSDGKHSFLSTWKNIIENVYNHSGFYLYAEKNNQIVGVLPLFSISSLLFENHLVSMPFLTYGGILADSTDIEQQFLCEVENLLKKQDVKYIELRQQGHLSSEGVNSRFILNTQKVSMRLELPSSSEELFNQFKAKLRSQIRRPQKEGMVFKLGGQELIDDFYKVFLVNMRDLGSPVHSKKLFKEIFGSFPDSVKCGVVYHNNKPVAAGIINLFNKFVEIPWASALREYNRFSPNMMLYWELIKYVTDAGYKEFDFGRSTEGESTFRFKQQWGSKPVQLNWYSSRQNSLTDADSKKKLFIQVWTKLPLTVSQKLGPLIRKGISL